MARTCIGVTSMLSLFWTHCMVQQIKLVDITERIDSVRDTEG